MSEQIHDLGSLAYLINSDCINNERFLDMMVVKFKNLNLNDSEINRLMHNMVENTKQSLEISKNIMEKAIILKQKLEEVEKI